MKKIFLLVYVTFCSLIFYQIILGKNGVIEGYRIEKEKERSILYFNLLKDQSDANTEYIEFLKNNPQALKSFAENLGFFQDDEIKFIKVLNEKENNNLDINNNQFVNEEHFNNSKQKLLDYNDLDTKINKIRTWLSIFFYIFFGFFIFLIIFGIKKIEE